MTVFVKNYVTECAICQQMKVNIHPTSPSLILIKGQKDAKPFSQVTCDFITDLPESDGFDSLMVVVDHGSTKGVISIPCNKTIDATLTAQITLITCTDASDSLTLSYPTAAHNFPPKSSEK